MEGGICWVEYGGLKAVILLPRLFGMGVFYASIANEMCFDLVVHKRKLEYQP